MRIGLLGGSFDPIHNAHVQMAKYARKQLNLDEIWFLVSNRTPLKDRKLTSYYDRCKMVQIAIHAYRSFQICTVEATSEGINYTIDTVIKLKKMYPEHQFYFIIGQDQVAQLDKWREIDRLQKEVQLCAFERNNLLIKSAYDVKKLSMPNYQVSSTSIRKGNFSEVHKGVCHYALSNMLYMDFVKASMSEFRYQHSVSVAKLCATLAKANHLDVKKAYLCGLLHDINKEFKLIDKQSSEKILKIMRPELLAKHSNIWHGYIGSFILAHKLNINDKDILLAIENHVLGECRQTYAMLLYVADKLDPLRKYDTTKGIELCKRNLYEGYKEVKRQQIQYYGEENVSGE